MAVTNTEKTADVRETQPRNAFGSTTVSDATSVKIELVGADGSVTVLKEKLALKAGEVVDCSVMNVKALRAFFASQMDVAKKEVAVNGGAGWERVNGWAVVERVEGLVAESVDRRVEGRVAESVDE